MFASSAIAGKAIVGSLDYTGNQLRLTPGELSAANSADI
jgi:hypothetical protein